MKEQSTKTSSEKKDIFCGRSPGLIILFIIFIIAAISPEPWQSWIYVIFMFAAAGLCLFNYNSCGRVHCKITGWGFLVVAIIALLKVSTVITLEWWIIWVLFLVVLLVGYSFEWYYRNEHGTCYNK